MKPNSERQRAKYFSASVLSLFFHFCAYVKRWTSEIRIQPITGKENNKEKGKLNYNVGK